MAGSTTGDVLRISGKHLGEFAQPDRCERCLWIKLQLGHRLPFGFFPGIFSTLDSFTKKVVHDHFDTFGRPPAWLEVLDVVDYIDPPHFSRFNMHDAESNVLLTGAADGIFQRSDRSLVITDYKTAKITSMQDSLFPTYAVQLNTYGLISEDIGLGPVSDLALVYMEPVADPAGGCAAAATVSGFQLGFDAQIRKVRRDTQLVKQLLGEARKLHDSPGPPAGAEGCKNCRLLEQLLRETGIAA